MVTNSSTLTNADYQPTYNAVNPQPQPINLPSPSATRTTDYPWSTHACPTCRLPLYTCTATAYP